MTVGARAQTGLVEQERKCHKDATANDEGQHVRNAVHEVLVDPAAQALGLAHNGGLSGRATGHVVNGRIACECDVDELLGVVDATRYGTRIDRLAVKAIELDVLVRRDDDARSTRDVGGRQHVLGAARALSFDLDAHAHLGGLVLKPLCCHKRMGNACRARRDGNDVVGAASRFLVCS